MDFAQSHLSNAVHIPDNPADFDPDWEVDPKDLITLNKLGKCPFWSRQLHERVAAETNEVLPLVGLMNGTYTGISLGLQAFLIQLLGIAVLASILSSWQAILPLVVYARTPTLFVCRLAKRHFKRPGSLIQKHAILFCVCVCSLV